jgi:hypothetical protein
MERLRAAASGARLIAMMRAAGKPTHGT